MRWRTDIEGKLNFGVATSSLPTSVHGAGSRSGGMEATQRFGAGAESGDNLVGGEIAQPEGDCCVLNHGILNGGPLGRRRLGCAFLSELVYRRSGGDGGGLESFLGVGRKALFGSEPMLPFGIAGEASVENSALQLGEFEFLIGDGIAGA